MPRQSRPWKEQMNRGSSYKDPHEKEKKPQKELKEFFEEEECQAKQN